MFSIVSFKNSVCRCIIIIVFHKFESERCVWNIFLFLRMVCKSLLLKWNMLMIQTTSLCIISVWVYYDIIIPYQCSWILNHIQFFFRRANRILLWWLYIFIEVLWLFSEIIKELWAVSCNYNWIRNVMHGCWKWNYPTKSSTVLYILESLLYLSVSTATLILYRINHKEIKLIGYCVVFIVTDLQLKFVPGCGGSATSGLSCFLGFAVTELPFVFWEVKVLM